ncbi:hypothetical protein MNV49_004848 [Pseudohyphozyma bogoriensis]|nr:hypothetical protein MNV49_004848 [Pseudohyphozyma bogoriensis]
MLLSWIWALIALSLSLDPVSGAYQQRPFIRPPIPHLDVEVPPSLASTTEGSNITALRNLQVHHPPIVPKGGKACQVLLLQHAFAFSYYDPSIVDYSPPLECGEPGSWAAVVLNLTVTVNGTQFDRLGSISLDHVEIWRTSTAEPTKTGIIWTAFKDVTRFMSLLAKNGTLMFDEGNIINDRYTGIFDTTLSATFYAPTPDFLAPASADVVIPLSTLSKTQSQLFIYPGETETNVTFPINAVEAYVEVLASGAGEEEFWYTNTPDSFVPYFDPDAGLIGKGPFREVQLLIDGKLAGVVYPFPVIFTGGANPLLWRPLASLRAFDVPSFWIDVTPFLPLLTDSQPHSFSFTVLGQGIGSPSVNNNWALTGSIHIRVDETLPKTRTTGKILSYYAPPTSVVSTAGHVASDNSTVSTLVNARRLLSISSRIETGSGMKVVDFTQELSFSNRQEYAEGGGVEKVIQTTEATTTSTHAGQLTLSDISFFPLTISTNYSSYPSSFSASIGPYSYDRSLLPPLITGGVGSTTKSSQSGDAVLVRSGDGKSYTGVSETEERYEYRNERGDTFVQVVRAGNSTIISDVSSGTLAERSAQMVDQQSGEGILINKKSCHVVYAFALGQFATES